MTLFDAYAAQLPEESTPPPGTTRGAYTEATQLAMIWSMDLPVIRDILIAKNASSAEIDTAVREYRAASRTRLLEDYGWVPAPL